MTSGRNDAFTRLVLGVASAEGAKPFEPVVRQDPDGDCIEFVALPHPYRGERISEYVTALYSIESGELMGTLIMGVSKLLKRNPGWIIELDDGKFKIAQLIRAAEAVALPPEEHRRLVYVKLAALAEKAHAEARHQPV